MVKNIVSATKKATSSSGSLVVNRQRSASYYTPEVVTEFTVRHTLDAAWEEHPNLTAAEILKLTVCEPALGSGAFLNETINQLAARYLKAAQDERGETIDADRYQLELQKAKAHFAINQCYGVELEPYGSRTGRGQPVAQLHVPGSASPQLRISTTPRKQPHWRLSRDLSTRTDQVVALEEHWQ